MGWAGRMVAHDGSDTFKVVSLIASVCSSDATDISNTCNSAHKLLQTEEGVPV